MDDFEEIWAIFPRKVAKHPARQEWNRLSGEDKFAALQSLPLHVKYWQLSNYSPEYIPHFRTWLHQRRWEDELVLPQTRRSSDDWMRSTAGIEAKARELGMWPPRAGEDWHSLKTRILARAA
jgi:hypothetical protein